MKEISDVKNVIAENNNAVKILKGIIIACIITFILLFVYGAVLTYTNVDESTAKPVIIAITGVSILARKLNRSRLNQKKRNIKRRNNRTYIYTSFIFSF